MTDHDHDHDYDYDYMTQYVRAYVVPDKPAEQHAGPETPRRVSAPSAVMPRASFGAARPRSDIDRTIQTVGAPYEGWKLILDCETTTDHRQQLRYGFYQLRGLSRANRRAAARCGTLTPDALNTLQAEGVYYNPAELSETETTIIIDFARTNGLRCMTRDAFVTDVFYPWVYTYGALCIGHNLPFDLSRLATAYGPASGTYRGGFWFTLCACGHAECFDHPPLRIKKIGPHKAFIGFRTVKPPTRGLSTATSTAPGTTRRIKRARGHILDTMTLGRALLGPGAASLAALGRTFRVDVTKMEHDIAHDGPLTMDDLTYARRDVAATWALYVKEAALYTRHGVPTPIRDIYSEASLGKAYYRALGVPPFMARNPDFPPDVLGAGMVAYYGGRSEVKIRLQPTEVIYCDFKSQYPTVNALMRLQDLLTAERVEPRDCTAEVRAWLENATTNATADTNTNAGSDDMLTLLQQPASWPLLRKLVKIVPHDDVLPIRADYQGKGGALNIGLNYVTGGPIWYTLADVAASVLVTGIVPEIQQALELVPIGRVATKPWALFGDARYTIDLDRQDFFTEVINLRTDVKGDMTRAASEGERANLVVRQALS